MGRKAFEIDDHGYTLEELKTMRNKEKSNYSRRILTVIILRLQGFNNKYIASDIQKSLVTVVACVNKWNDLGIDSLIDNRGGSTSKFTAEMKNDLIKTLNESTPNSHNLIGFNWTTPLLAEYINKKYDTSYSDETIRRILKSENYTFKRAQPKPSKADELEKENFKKNENNFGNCRKFF
ncbi:winged helix-turn-helix domain-containing protein [Clostridium sp. PL3]|uniref:Winged helix-turn-helix domain-containing protein n=1 Tax=Clostridium thailandense TaxID=2794346 RepID=A0A949TQV8_9CLOT|nr:winged helix-turn-helix domain-containing protein [Clostridium thailandense]MBV7276870.1 winged helix-turn-helix domain-containing protein [Clostridium thailandense]